jgi:hypothetical protein
VAKRDDTTMQRGNTVHIDSHAAATLRYIRASMEAAASLAVPGSTGIASGLIGLLAAMLSSIPALKEHWFAIWLVAAVLAAGLGAALMAQQSSWRALTLVGTPLRKFALGLLPSLAAGAALTAYHWSHANWQAIPGTWLILYGCGLVSASVVTSRSMGVLGGTFFLLGIAALLLPDEWQIVVLGLGFGGLHLAFGVWEGRVGRGR